jgi:hypothetical protein
MDDTLKVAMFLVLSVSMSSPCLAQEKKVTQTSDADSAKMAGASRLEEGCPQPTRTIPLNVYNTKMAPFRDLAELSFGSWKNRDYATAATLAKLLHKFWDATGGDVGEETKTPMNPEMFKKIDSAMASFIEPIVGYGEALTHGRPPILPDEQKLELEYKNYLEVLKSGD